MSSKITEKLSVPFTGVAHDNMWVLSIQVIIILCVTVVLSLLVYHLLSKLKKRINKTTFPYISAIVRGSLIPAVVLICILGLDWLLALLKSLIHLPIIAGIPVVKSGVLVVLFGWTFIHISRKAFLHLQAADFKNTTLSSSAAELVFKLTQVFIAISTGLILLQTIGISISGLLAFGGLGGLVVGFAAKDTLANLFSGMMLYMDRPFKVGERIYVAGKEIEGTVEKIGWRQTRIRNYELQPIYVPNAIFSSTAVLTPSRMLNRRMSHTLGIRYNDFSQVNIILTSIRAFLKNHSHIDQNRPVRVNFINFGNFSLDLKIYCFTKSPGLDDFLAVQEEVLLSIGKIIQQNSADFAFPTQTLDIEWPK